MNVRLATRENTFLSPQRRARRLIAVAALAATLLLIRAMDPVAAGAWLPFHPSCGAVSGLPCIFCGMTRALHFLLNGDFSRALYFNWLAFPLIAGVICLSVLLTMEIASQRQLLRLDLIASISSRRLAIILLMVAALWTVQAYLAVSQHKHELLNPGGPLYALFVK
ncbi:MAG: hypothetical protein DMG68_19705 [Acidobacteria bacterium]|nr:MAG: hypothetical protein DMG68_19705 [Acidobacteriota bacterium]